MATIIGRRKSDCWDPGNSQTQFYEEYYRCDECNGKGDVKADRQALINHLRTRFSGKDKIFSKALFIYYLWKKYGRIECPECDGVGEWCETKS